MKRSNTPRRKRMNRKKRLASVKVKEWIKTYSGKNIVKGYMKWYGVDYLCAITELRLLGIEISEAQELRLKNQRKTEYYNEKDERKKD